MANGFLVERVPGEMSGDERREGTLQIFASSLFKKAPEVFGAEDIRSPEKTGKDFGALDAVGRQGNP